MNFMDFCQGSKIKKEFFFIFALGLMLGGFVFAQFNPPGNNISNEAGKIQINFFYSAICPHCAKEKEFLKDLKEKYPKIEVKEYEVLYHQENQEILEDFYKKYQVPRGHQGRVPVIFTSHNYFIGFNEQIAKDIEGCIEECLAGERPIIQKIKIPIFGEIDISKMSLPVLTIVLGALDGLNPCAMWILLFLITLLLNSRSRKRIWLIGGTFIAASGIVYFLILSAWLNLFLAISYVNLTRILIGTFALGFGVWQIKNFITFKPNICKIIDGKSSLTDKVKNILKTRTEKLAVSPLTLGILGGIIILALGINLIEFFCSAGLPATFTRILSLNPLSALSYYFYLLLYTFVFILDDIIVFLIAAITLSRVDFTHKYNYWATLIGGLLMLILGILLIFKPEFLMFG